MTTSGPPDRAREPVSGAPIDATATAPFDAPWQVRAIAILLSLQRRGLVVRAEWADALGAELRHAREAGEPDTPRGYHACVLHALADRLCAHGVADPGQIERLRAAWQRAARRTPHGEPLELRAEDLG